MSGPHSPMPCADFTAILKEGGVSPGRGKSGTSPKQWIGDSWGRVRKVTVDGPKAPVTQALMSSSGASGGRYPRADIRCVFWSSAEPASRRGPGGRAALRFKLSALPAVYDLLPGARAGENYRMPRTPACPRRGAYARRRSLGSIRIRTPIHGTTPNMHRTVRRTAAEARA